MKHNLFSRLEHETQKQIISVNGEKIQLSKEEVVGR